MVFIFPLVPVLVGVCVIAMALTSEVQERAPAIANVLFVLILIAFAAIAIYNIVAEISNTRKVISSILCPVLGVICAFIVKSFVLELGAIEFGILGFIEFLFTGAVGGGIICLVVFGCMYLCTLFSD